MGKFLDLRFLSLILKMQWRDRIATSSFLIGITIQTLTLSFALYSRASTPLDALEMAIRASLFTGVSILLFSSMSSLQNEFRFGTIENVLIVRRGLNELIAYRAIGTALISSPGILIPFLFAAIKFPSTLSLATALVILMIYIFISLLCYELSYLINCFEQPSITLPILRFVLLMGGLRLVPGAWSIPVSYLFPSGWILALIHDEYSLAQISLGFFATAFISVGVSYFWFRPIVERSIERRLVSGRLS